MIKSQMAVIHVKDFEGTGGSMSIVAEADAMRLLVAGLRLLECTGVLNFEIKHMIKQEEKETC